MSLPNPDNYDDWRSYASALIRALSLGDGTAALGLGTGSGGSNTGEPGAGSGGDGAGPVPAGYAPVWLSADQSALWLGNNDSSPPAAPALFMVDTSHIADAAITTGKILDGSVGTIKIVNDAITSVKLATNSVTSAKIVDAAIISAKIGDAQIITAKIADAAILTAKIADAAIVSAKIGDLQVTTAKIDNLAVNSAKIANLAVTSAKIANLAVGTAQIDDLAVTSAKIVSILTSKLTVASNSPDLLRNGNAFDGIDSWKTDAAATSAGAQFLANTGFFSLSKLATGDSIAVNALAIPVIPGQTYVFRGLTRGSSSTAGGLYVRLYHSGVLPASGYVDATNYVTYTDLIANGPFTIADARFEFTWTCPAGVYWVGPTIYDFVGGPLVVDFTQMSFKLQSGTADIENAAITNAKIANLAVDTAKIANAAITNAKIGNAEVDSAKIANLVVDKLLGGVLGAQIDVGAGYIRWSNGTVMLHIAVNFGSTNQFIMWFGPSMAPNLCTEANGEFWLRNDGSGYFGGSLSSGILKNSGTTSSLATNASISVGPFGTIGGPIQVATGWSYSSTTNANYPATIAGRNAFLAAAATYGATDPDADGFYSGGNTNVRANSVLTLERSVGGGAFASVATAGQTVENRTFNGQVPVPGVDPGYATIVESMGISFTYTDSLGGVADREFRATIARGYSASGTQSQRVSIVSTE